jgi:hypothetical protein
LGHDHEQHVVGNAAKTQHEVSVCLYAIHYCHGRK